MSDKRIPVVLIVNSNDDIVTAVREALEDEGFKTSSGHVHDVKLGKLDLVELLERDDPDVVIYDLAPPYENNWTFLKLVLDSKSFTGRALVLTTTNKRALDDLVGETHAIEILGKPYDLEQIIEAVRNALEAAGKPARREAEHGDGKA